MKNIVLGVTGSIAAYKALSLVRLLSRAGKEVRVIMTPAATAFVAPLSFATLSKNQVFVNMIDDDSWNNHVDLGLWADALVIAPATATTLSKMANGQSDNMLIATYLSARCPVFFAPAMDLDMWEHPATQSNIQKLISFGNHLVPVGHGELASGLVGEGRMAEPEEIVELLEAFSKKKVDLIGKRVLITAGPTREPIDPVRFISNHSSGRMGIALAEECAQRGAHVDLVIGPSNLNPQNPSISLYKVINAQEMYDRCVHLFDDCQIAIFAAAVSDYTPISYHDQKLKKTSGQLNIELKRTPDIAGSLGKKKKQGQVTVGFAMETQNETENALAKLHKKSFDIIVLNSLNEEGAGFQHDTNKVTIFKKDGESRAFPLKTKRKVAEDIVNSIHSLFVHN